MSDPSNRRVPMRELPAHEAVQSFAEVTLGYSREESIAEARRARDVDLAPTVEACPFHVDIPAFVGAIAEGDFEAAKQRIVEAHPWPSILGRWCAKYCERAHRVADGEPIFLSALERAAGDYGAARPSRAATRPNPLRIAVLGAGSGGAGATYRLRALGHEVDVYERLPVAGGMMAAGYPEFRLPLAVVQREVDPTAWGASLHGESDLTRERFDAIRASHDAVVIATGKVKEARLGLPGESAAGVWDALDLLKRVKLGGAIDVGPRCAVFGAGYTAQDVSRTLARLGREVTVYYRRTKEEMPVVPRNRDRYVARQAAENAPYVFQVAPIRIDERDGRVVGVTCVRTEPGEPDAGGRNVPIPVPGSEFQVACDAAILATGETLDVSFAPEDLLLTEGGSIWVDPNTYETNLSRVFAVGAAADADNTSMAFASGIACADAIDALVRRAA